MRFIKIATATLVAFLVGAWLIATLREQSRRQGWLLNLDKATEK